MTLMTAMTMNCRGSLNGVRHSAVESRDRAMGREHGERKRDQARCGSGAKLTYPTRVFAAVPAFRSPLQILGL
jgi:hypothetical protein